MFRLCLHLQLPSLHVIHATGVLPQETQHLALLALKINLMSMTFPTLFLPNWLARMSEIST